jgi:hypothetical protein
MPRWDALPPFLCCDCRPSLLAWRVLCLCNYYRAIFFTGLGSGTLMTSVTVKSLLETSFVIGTAITGNNFVLSQFSEVKYMRPHQMMSRVSQTHDVTGLYIL